MSGKEIALLREQLVHAMLGDEAHLLFKNAVKDFPAHAYGVKPVGAPHSGWQLLEHLRIAQHDILEFSRNPKHESPKFPEGYWPESAAPPDAKAWQASVQSFERDAKELEKLIQDTQQDLFRPFAHGDGQTLLREALVVAAHNSYHLGQLVFLKKILAG